MIGYCITIEDHVGSLMQSKECEDSIKESGNDWWLQFHHFPATPSDEGYAEWEKRNIEYRGSPTPPPAKAACAASHFRLWEKCAEGNEPIVVLEHDALFVRRLTDDDFTRLMDSKYKAISLYRPGGEYLKGPIKVDKYIAGWERGVLAKSYILKPSGARLLIDIIKERKYMIQNDKIDWSVFPHQAAFYKEVVDDTCYLDRNLGTSKGYK